MPRLFPLLLLLTIAATCSAGRFRMDVVAISPDAVLEKTSCSSNIVFETPDWVKNKKNLNRRWLWVLGSETGSQWQNIEFRFKSSRTTRIRLTASWTGKKPGLPDYAALRDFKIQNTRSVKWQYPKKAPELLTSGTAEIPYSVQDTVFCEFNVHGGEETVVSGGFRPLRNDEIRQPEPPDPVTYRKHGWELKIDRGSGNWLELRAGSALILKNPSNRSSFYFNDGGSRQTLNPEHVEFDEASGTVTLSRGNRDWEMRERIRFVDDARIRVNAELAPRGNELKKFRRFIYSLSLPAEGEYFYPGTFFHDKMHVFGNFSTTGHPESERKGKFRDLPSRTWWRTAPHVKFLAVSPGVLVIPEQKTESAGIALKRLPDSVALEIPVDIAGWAEKGQIQHITGFELYAAPGTALKTLFEQHLPACLAKNGLHTPADRPEWVQDMAIFGMDLERFKMATFQDFRKGMSKRIRELGFNTVWFLPVQEGTVSYNPNDYYKPEYPLGSWDEYRAMVRELRQNGIRVLQDIVPHGGTSPVSLIHYLFGETGYILNSRPKDFYSPEWNRYMADVTRFYMRMGISGFRVDAIGGSSMPNWRRRGFPSKIPNVVQFQNRYNPKPTTRTVPPERWNRFLNEYGSMPAPAAPRASYSTLAGGLRMAETIRSAAKEITPDAVTLLEVQGFPFSTKGDLLYDLLSCQLIHKLIALPPEQFVTGLRTWLEDQQLSDLPGVVLMRYLVSNDNLISRQFAGYGVSKALLAWNWFVPGVPLGYGDNDNGFGEYLRKLNAVRAAIPDLRRAKADFRSVRSSAPEIFLMRRGGTVVAINFSGREISAELSVPADLKLRHDVLNSRPAGTTLHLLPWECAVLTGSNLNIPQTAVAGKGEVLKLQKENGRFLIPDGCSYQINTVEGLIEDWHSFRDWEILYHRQTLRTPSDSNRIWDSRFNPLHPAAPEIRIFRKDGRGMAITLPPDAKLVMRNVKQGFELITDLPELQCRPVGERLRQTNAPVWKSGERSLTFDGLAWIAEHPDYRIRLARAGGGILEFFDKRRGKVLLRNQSVSLKNGAATRFDPETRVSFREEKGDLILEFQGEAQFLKRLLPFPFEVCTEYRFPADGSIHLSCRYRNSIGDTMSLPVWKGTADAEFRPVIAENSDAVRPLPGGAFSWGADNAPRKWQKFGMELTGKATPEPVCKNDPAEVSPEDGGFEFAFYRAHKKGNLWRLWNPDPYLWKSLNPGILQAGKRYTLELTLHNPVRPLTLDIRIRCWNKSGKPMEESFRLKLPAGKSRMKKLFHFTLREDGFAPTLNLEYKNQIPATFLEVECPDRLTAE